MIQLNTETCSFYQGCVDVGINFQKRSTNILKEKLYDKTLEGEETEDFLDIQSSLYIL